MKKIIIFILFFVFLGSHGVLAQTQTSDTTIKEGLFRKKLEIKTTTVVVDSSKSVSIRTEKIPVPEATRAGKINNKSRKHSSRKKISGIPSWKRGKYYRPPKPYNKRNNNTEGCFDPNGYKNNKIK